MTLLSDYSTPFDAKAASQDLTGIALVRPSKLQGPLTFRVLPSPASWPAHPVAGASGAWRKGPFVGHHKHIYDDPMSPGSYVAFECPERNGTGQACPTCAVARPLRASQDQVQKDKGFDLSASHMVMVNILVRSGSADGMGDLGGQVVTLELSAPNGKPSGKTQYEKLLAAASHPTNGGDIVNPAEGYDVVLTKSGSGQRGTSYDFQLIQRGGPCRLSPGDDDEIVHLILTQPNLPEMLTADVAAGRAKALELGQGGGSVSRGVVAALPRPRTAEDEVYGDTEIVDDIDY